MAPTEVRATAMKRAKRYSLETPDSIAPTSLKP